MVGHQRRGVGVARQWASFANAGFTGIPAGEVIIGFGAGRANGLLRCYALTGTPGNVWATNMGPNYWQTIRNVYTMTNMNGAWTPSSNGINITQDYAVYLAMAENDPSTCYIAGSTPNAEAIVMKTADGGLSWQHCYLRNNNQNIFTGYQGYGGDLGYSWGGNALGFGVSPLNSQHVVLTDYGFIHQTLNGGQNWHQAYTSPSDENPAGSPTPKKQYYHGVGMEQTTCWQVYWMDAQTMIGCFTDIKGVRSEDAGDSWSFDYTGHNLNTLYRIVKHNTSNLWFAATSSVHDIYQTTYVTDAKLQPSYKDGYVLYSSNKGKDWLPLRDFDNPVIWVATDPGNNERLYAGVISTNPAIGGIWRADGISNPGTVQWTKINNPPANNGRIFNIQVLNDGMLVSTWSARKSNAGSVFSDSSGVFVSTNGGVSWQRRNHPDMNYWTKDLVVDPADPSQNTWYACVWSGWGGPANNLGRIFRSTDRGLNWQPISAPGQFFRVSSVSIDPADPETMYLTTEYEGLWVTHNKSAAMPDWQLVDAYPFHHPERVFFNPYNPQECWVASFGNGMRKGTTATSIHPLATPAYDFRILKNPCEGNIAIEFSLKVADQIRFSLWNNTGVQVMAFTENDCQAGQHRVQQALPPLPAGIYFLQMAGNKQAPGLQKIAIK
ncbi:MAG: hypothetical protein IPL65_09695 [Lewinellaceae bacterium]|nr:hypothetical protein [Lewinellaceae bacterium]